MTNIYILRLQGGKYYVGRTENVERRYEEHMAGTGSLWTRMYRPIGIDDTISNASAYDEDRYVKEYMAVYGIDNVRGGAYVLPKLDATTVAFIQKEIWNAQNRCIGCGSSNHFVRDCSGVGQTPETTTIEELEAGCLSRTITFCISVFTWFLLDQQSASAQTTAQTTEPIAWRPTTRTKQVICYRCKRPNHYANRCYYKTDIDGNKIVG